MHLRVVVVAVAGVVDALTSIKNRLDNKISRQYFFLIFSIMKTSDRDLLVLTKSYITNKKEMDSEVQKLHELLYWTESMENFCVANEILDLDSYKLIDNPSKIQKLILKKLKPFQFVSNKN